ncbi:unnamed protein product [Phytomonas sp. Hart1]|nr:unnamed protein product [Phytomonas sp. Hart1]|eukprot:CCW67696.1 unnamed protein product [Phytomonas sp. isolate Hart1]
MDRDVSLLSVGSPAPCASSAAVEFRLRCDTTVVWADYHMCRYDPLLGVLLCVGNGVGVVVLGKDFTRRLLPTSHHGTGWIDAGIYPGTTTFLLLAPEVLIGADYGASSRTDSFLPSRDPTAAFTCLHLPAGLTCGAVGRKNGVVSYFAWQPTEEGGKGRAQISWTAVSTNLLGLCEPFLPDAKAFREVLANEAVEKVFLPGSVLSLDSHPENPNSFVGVVAGVPGVCKWGVAEGRLGCFFDSRSLKGQTDCTLVTCKITPGGVYVVAATLYATKVVVWIDKKKKHKTIELHWVIDLSESITRGVQQSSSDESFWYNEYRVGIHMARATLDGVPSTDKRSLMYLLVHGQSDIVEIVLRLELKQVVRLNQVIECLNATTASTGMEALIEKKQGQNVRRSADNSDTEEYFKIFHVEPCAISKYWPSTLTQTDLQALLITSSGGLRPILAKRSQQMGGIESLQEIRELSASVAWFPRAILLSLPEVRVRALAAGLPDAPQLSSYEALLRGGDALLLQGLREDAACDSSGHLPNPLWRGMLFATVLEAAQAVCLAPQTNEIFAVNSMAVRSCPPWASLTAAECAGTLVLEEALPALDVVFLPNEIILRVYSTELGLMAMKFDIRRNGGSLVWYLDRAALQLESHTTSEACLVKKAIVVDARLDPSSANSTMSIYQTGKSLLLLLEDSSIALVDLSGVKDEDGRPYMIHIPFELMPAETTTVCIDAFWSYNSSASTSVDSKVFCVVCLFADGKGFFVFNLSNMNITTYQQPSYLLNAQELKVTNALPPLLPNLGGDIHKYEVIIETTNIPDKAGEYGEVVCSDAIGARVFTILIGFGLSGNGDGWCYRIRHPQLNSERDLNGVLRWICINTSASVLHFTFNVSSDGTTLDLLIDGQTSDAGPTINLPGTIVDIRAIWHLGRAELFYCTPTGNLCSHLLNPDSLPTNCNLSGKTSGAPRKDCTPTTIAFISKSEITLVDITALLAMPTNFPLEYGITTDNSSSFSTGLSTPVVCRIDSARRLEFFHVLRRRGALLVITCDANGWRWINILHSQMAKPRMQGYATLDFVSEEHLQVLPVEIDNVLHVYMLGMNSGTIGHLCIETTLGADSKSVIIEREVFPKPNFQPVPWNYRGYSRFIPPIPTLKQERGFFERLMILPWEDIAQKLEFETFRSAQPSKSVGVPQGSFDRAARSSEAPAISAPCTEVQTSSFSLDASHRVQRQKEIRSKELEELLQSNAKATSEQAPPSGSRYLQLKAIAERENVSLTEARRMMSEGMRKLQERGEKISQIESRSRELAQSALTFQQLAKKLKEKNRSSWL